MPLIKLNKGRSFQKSVTQPNQKTLVYTENISDEWRTIYNDCTKCELRANQYTNFGIPSCPWNPFCNRGWNVRLQDFGLINSFRPIKTFLQSLWVHNHLSLSLPSLLSGWLWRQATASVVSSFRKGHVLVCLSHWVPPMNRLEGLYTGPSHIRRLGRLVKLSLMCAINFS